MGENLVIGGTKRPEYPGWPSPAGAGREQNGRNIPGGRPQLAPVGNKTAGISRVAAPAGAGREQNGRNIPGGRPQLGRSGTKRPVSLGKSGDRWNKTAN